ncbi:hypothetical protein C2G38_2153715 [Gigaspora rosea]|uniref:Uncharacterized protein n=1 Tax=Gigaspora rosea TaxID=44941 RepID=A0A397W8Z4_9GLOM|nr:hypothetical protein C2G38_2153715 [Gigaspora rosea]
MHYLLVQVNEGVKCIIPERVMSIDPISNQFLDLFDAIMLGQYNNRVIKVFIRRKKSNGWQDLNNRLSDTSDSTQDGPNAFSILMANSRLPLLPRSCTKYNSYNRLYNEIIELFQAQKVGWMNALHETIRKTFVARLAIQSQMLRKESDDAHYCAALFRYLREFCIQYHQWFSLIAADDKHKIPIGEDIVVSTVIFFISIPNNISGSFYNGQVFVLYKDTVFEPSTAIRHLTEFLKALNIKYKNQTLPPILCLYTNRVHTAPNHSWTNPAKRIITNTLDDIHKKAHEYIKLESELKESIADVQEILNNHTERLQLKNNKFKCYFSASKEDITEIFESIFRINPTLKIKKTTQIQKCHHLELIKFIDTHCQARAYSFQIKKCNNFSCLYCKPTRLLSQEFDNLSLLPDPISSKDYYAKFQQVYGTKTTEEHRPMYIQSQAKSVSIPKNILIAEKI